MPLLQTTVLPVNGGFIDYLMKQVNTSEYVSAEKHTESDTPEIKGAAASSSHDTFSGAAIDFHLPEFNRTDDLNDNFGNCQSFEPLDGIITADMRHQMERLSESQCVYYHVDEAADSNEIKTAIEFDEPELVKGLSPLTVISEGRALIVDTDAARATKCADILSDQQLTCTIALIKKASQDASIPRFNKQILIEADDISITGALGDFSATVTVKSNQRQLTERFDLVLDLQLTPSFAGGHLPIGYYAPGSNTEALYEAMAEMPSMRGRFQKPQFIAFQGNVCLHGRSRTLDCRKCIDVCPFGAIRSVDRKISVNHYLCEGCGGCASVCQADAIRLAYPSQEEILNTLRSSLESRRAGVYVPLTMLISDSETADYVKLQATGEKANDRTVQFEVEQIGYIRLEMILSAFVWGASRVMVVCGQETPPGIRKAVEWQAQMAGEIVTGIGLPKDSIRFAVIPPENVAIEQEVLMPARIDTEDSYPAMPAAALSPTLDKRTLVRLAAQHLHDHYGCEQRHLSLPAGSPFGAVMVDAVACTQCMACVAACPSGALSAGGNVPRLLFGEARCHQCGLCRETCPEHAIQLLPRMLCNLEQVEAPAVLCESEAFRCIKCNAPFAPKAMVNRMTEKLKNHWMYANQQQLLRLKMCSVCRTRDALSSEDMRLWNR